jgi:hypothetical protein
MRQKVSIGDIARLVEMKEAAIFPRIAAGDDNTTGVNYDENGSGL